MASTTIKLSTETRDRIRALGGATYEETVIEALDVLEAQRFWGEAVAAAEARAQAGPADRARRAADEDALDQALDGLG